MYVIVLAVVLAISLAIFFSPIFAVILFVLALLGLGAYKFLAQGTEPEHAPAPSDTQPPANAPSTRSSGAGEDEDTGPWGEKWPEQRSGEESSRPTP